MIQRVTAAISENREIASGVYRLVLADAREAGPVAATADDGAAGCGVTAIAAAAAPGQFVNIYLNNNALLLPRPLSISDVESVWEGTPGRDSFDAGTGSGPRLVFVYAAIGAGTAELASYAPGTKLHVLGPQGNGYDFGVAGRRALLIGGGLGIPPLLFAARRLRESAGRGGGATRDGAHEALRGGKVAEPGGEVNITALLGYRDEPYYSEEMGRYCDEVFGISEFRKNAGAQDARAMRGTVMDLIARLEADSRLDLTDASVLACGPLPMLRAVSEWAALRSIPAQVSLEERMGCGYGACVGCTIAVRAVASPIDASRVVRMKVCKDGPVFPSDVILW